MEKDLKAPKIITIEATDDTAFRYFRVNFTQEMKAGDKVVLTAASSEEAAYYLALADEDKGITVTAADAE